MFHSHSTLTLVLCVIARQTFLSTALRAHCCHSLFQFKKLFQFLWFFCRCFGRFFFNSFAFFPGQIKTSIFTLCIFIWHRFILTKCDEKKTNACTATTQFNDNFCKCPKMHSINTYRRFSNV